MDTTRNNDLRWRKPSACSSGSACVEIAALPGGGAAIRNSADPTGPQLRFNAAEWAAFLVAVKADQFDPSAEA